MKRKIKICFRVLLIILVTVACIMAGIHTRQAKAIVVTQFGQISNNSKGGYLLETEENRLVMVDGGSKEDTVHLLDTIKQKGGVVEAWFITLPHTEHAGVILDALKNSEIQINGIYVSLNERDWYEEFEDKNQIEFVNGFIDVLESDNVRDRVHEVQNRDELNIDNLNFKILKTKNPKYIENAGNNQSMIIKASNNFKSMIFLSDFGVEYQEDFINNNQDEISADAVQVSYHGANTSNELIYKSIKPKISFWNIGKTQNIEGCKETYSSKYGDITVEIW